RYAERELRADREGRPRHRPCRDAGGNPIMERSPVFSLRDVVKVYGEKAAIAGVSFEINEGEQVALIGPSGAGKSTLLGLLNGTEQPTSGTLQVLGQSLME